MKSKPAIWVDGEPVSALPLPDRGLDFGDGVFETLLLHQGAPLFLQLHLERLGAGLQALSMPDCLQRAQTLLTTCAAHYSECQWAAMRLTVTRGSAPRGYAAPENPQLRIIITAAELSDDRSEFASPLDLGWSRMRWSSQPLLAGIKHLNRLEQVIAANEAREMSLDDVLVLDQQGHVNSLSAGNIFIYESGKLLTPALETCGIAGTRRRLIMESIGPALGLEVEQTHIHPEQVLAASALVCCNSVRGVQAVASLDDSTWTDFSLAEAIHRQYMEACLC